MDIEPLPSILEVVERGRAGRGKTISTRRALIERRLQERRARVGVWSHLRAVVLTLESEGQSMRMVGEELGLSPSRVSVMHAEACDAVLRTEPFSDEAEAVCARTWRRWCDQGGDAVACKRV
jgi:hypothetical protein